MRYYVGLFLLVTTLCAFGQGDYTLALELEPAGKLYSVSPNGRYAVVESHLAPITVWNLQEKRIVGLFSGHKVISEGRSFPVDIEAVAIRDDGWLLSSASMNDGELESALLAHNLQTGQRDVLVGTGQNCTALAVVPDGFVSSCTTPFSQVIIGAEMAHWQVSPTGVTRVHSVPVPLLSAIDFNSSQQKISAVEAFPMDVFTPVTIYNYPSLSFAASFAFDGSVPFMVGNGQRTLVARHEHNIHELYDLFGSEGPSKIDTIDYVDYSPVALSATALVGSFENNGNAYNLFDVNSRQYVQRGIEPLFATTLGWAAPSTGTIIWTGEQTSYYLPILRLWATGSVSATSNISDYAFVFTSPDWEVLTAHDMQVQNQAKGYDTLYAASPEALARQFLSHNDVRIMNQDANSVTLSAEIPVQDDSIRAERYELSVRSFQLANGQSVWGLYEARKQHQCTRGNTNVWTKARCP